MTTWGFFNGLLCFNKGNGSSVIGMINAILLEWQMSGPTAIALDPIQTSTIYEHGFFPVPSASCLLPVLPLFPVAYCLMPVAFFVILPYFTRN